MVISAIRNEITATNTADGFSGKTDGTRGITTIVLPIVYMRQPIAVKLIRLKLLVLSATE
jgi:hypothetical protein